ncbi:MAG: alpha/beta hydrolase [Symploca sp. SIO2C1]|nr:alpha/beta hydrolase [Symploca sp. SIO2C1]
MLRVSAPKVNFPPLTSPPHIKTQKPKKNRGRLFRWCSQLAFSLGLGIFAAFSATPVLGAERIAFWYSPFGEFYISIEDLEIFAKEGRITNEFAFYANRVPPEQLTQLRELLNQRFDYSPIVVYKFSNSTTGETILKKLGQIIKADFERNGFHALRASLNQAAASPEGLTIVNFLRQFPLETIRLDLEPINQVINQLSLALQEGSLLLAKIQEQATTEATTEPPVDFSTLPDLRLTGSGKWRKNSFTFTNPRREEPVPFDIYLPTTPREGLTEFIIISHGLGSNRHTFAYLAEHLVSHGFGVAVLEHPGSSTQKIKGLFAGFGDPPEAEILISRPLDIKYLLDELSAKAQTEPNRFGKLNLQSVGVIGQSLGGYTVLAAGGATLNFPNLTTECAQAEAGISLNVSLLLQCQGLDLPKTTTRLRDERVKAVIAINPLSSAIFGRQGMSEIEVPLMMISSTQDAFAPAVPEQLFPFLWLTTPNKYLVVTEGATHFSFLGAKSGGAFELPPELVGPDPMLAQPYLSALSTAFFKTYIANQPEYAVYLSEPYVKAISEDPFNLILVKYLTEAQIQEVTSAAARN